MKSLIRVLLLIALSLFAVFLLLAQQPPPHEPSESAADQRLPNGRLQKDEILKADHNKNLADAQELIRLSGELKTDLEKNTQFVYSIATVKKTEEIEKLAHKIRARLKRQ